MNVALPALVVFIVLLPGFIARSRIKRTERSSLDYSPFGQVVSEAVVWAAVLHVVLIVATEWFTSMTFRPDVALKLLSAEPVAQTKALEATAAQAKWVALYFGWLFLIAYLLPTGVRKLITWARWDREDSKLSSLVRFSGAPWYYLLSGADFAENEVPDCISISAIVDVSGEPYIYTGILTDYFLDQDGQLDRLILEEVMRRPLSKDKSTDGTDRKSDRFYPIDGDYFVLRYSEAVTLNVEYIKLVSDQA